MDMDVDEFEVDVTMKQEKHNQTSLKFTELT